MTTATPRPSIVSVYDGRHCLGFVLRRANGFEAYTADERSLGTFPTMKAAADAISNAHEERAPTNVADALVRLHRDIGRRLRGRS